MTNEEIVAALAEALKAIYDGRGRWHWLAEDLLPVVCHIAEQRAAEELLAAADDRHGEPCCGGPCADDLHARATALTAVPPRPADLDGTP